MTNHAVLIFSHDPLAAALLAAAVELAGHAPYFARAGESARAALMRIRPQLVLIDCDHEETCADSFVGPALMANARVLLLRSARTIRDATDMAARLGLQMVEMPAGHDQLVAAIRGELDDSGDRDSATGPL